MSKPKLILCSHIKAAIFSLEICTYLLKSLLAVKHYLALRCSHSGYSPSIWSKGITTEYEIC